MSGKAKETGELKSSHQEELEIKRKKFREWVKKNPYPMEGGIEFKECEGCYCQMSHNSGYDFCFDLSCGEHKYDSNTGNCCACFGGKCERGCIFFYWKQIGIDKQFCEKCQKLCEEEETRLEEDSKREMEELDKSS